MPPKKQTNAASAARKVALENALQAIATLAAIVGADDDAATAMKDPALAVAMKDRFYGSVLAEFGVRMLAGEHHDLAVETKQLRAAGKIVHGSSLVFASRYIEALMRTRRKYGAASAVTSDDILPLLAVSGISEFRGGVADPEKVSALLDGKGKAKRWESDGVLARILVLTWPKAATKAQIAALAGRIRKARSRHVTENADK